MLGTTTLRSPRAETAKEGRIASFYRSPPSFSYEGDLRRPHASVGWTLHGEGRLELPDGSFIEGTFVKGEIIGPGRRVWPDGSLLEADFEDGEACGHGRRSWVPDGSSYEGGFSSGLYHGQGCLLYSATGKRWRYTGGFVRGKFHGEGCLEELLGGDDEGGQGGSNSTGHVYRGSFIGGAKHGRGQETAPGLRYSGGFADGKRQGRGRLETDLEAEELDAALDAAAGAGDSEAPFTYDGAWVRDVAVESGAADGLFGWVAPWVLPTPPAPAAPPPPEPAPAAAGKGGKAAPPAKAPAAKGGKPGSAAPPPAAEPAAPPPLPLHRAAAVPVAVTAPLPAVALSVWRAQEEARAAAISERTAAAEAAAAAAEAAAAAAAAEAARKAEEEAAAAAAAATAKGGKGKPPSAGAKGKAGTAPAAEAAPAEPPAPAPAPALPLHQTGMAVCAGGAPASNVPPSQPSVSGTSYTPGSCKPEPWCVPVVAEAGRLLRVRLVPVEWSPEVEATQFGPSLPPHVAAAVGLVAGANGSRPPSASAMGGGSGEGSSDGPADGGAAADAEAAPAEAVEPRQLRLALATAAADATDESAYAPFFYLRTRGNVEVPPALLPQPLQPAAEAAAEGEAPPPIEPLPPVLASGAALPPLHVCPADALPGQYTLVIEDVTAPLPLGFTRLAPLALPVDLLPVEAWGGAEVTAVGLTTE